MIGMIAFIVCGVAAISIYILHSQASKKKEEPKELPAPQEEIWVCYECGTAVQLSSQEKAHCCPSCGKEDEMEQMPKEFKDPGKIFVCPYCGSTFALLTPGEPAFCPSCKKRLNQTGPSKEILDKIEEFDEFFK